MCGALCSGGDDSEDDALKLGGRFCLLQTTNKSAG